MDGEEIGLAKIGALREPVATPQTRDPKLADQTPCAAQSISLGSAGELRAALDVAVV